jgi:hypothetical protein
LVRFRLRFLLQEIDLPQGETLLGRSTSCQLTFDDPLVSRVHARLCIEGERATIEDLGSRNGVQVGGKPIKAARELNEGDRIRIGMHELVFCRVQPPTATRKEITRSTGFLCHCASCGIPYPADLVQCPSCGSNERSDEDTMSGVESQRNWSLELLTDVLRKALSLGRWDDATRLLERARANVENNVAGGQLVDPGSLEAVADAAAAVALAKEDAQWGHWVLTIYAELGAPPPASVLHRLGNLPHAQRKTLLEVGRRLMERIVIAKNVPPSDIERVAAFVSLLDSGLQG